MAMTFQARLLSKQLHKSTKYSEKEYMQMFADFEKEFTHDSIYSDETLKIIEEYFMNEGEIDKINMHIFNNVDKIKTLEDKHKDFAKYHSDRTKYTYDEMFYLYGHNPNFLSRKELSECVFKANAENLSFEELKQLTPEDTIKSNDSYTIHMPSDTFLSNSILLGNEYKSSISNRDEEHKIHLRRKYVDKYFQLLLNAPVTVPEYMYFEGIDAPFQKMIEWRFYFADEMIKRYDEEMNKK